MAAIGLADGRVDVSVAPSAAGASASTVGALDILAGGVIQWRDTIVVNMVVNDATLAYCCNEVLAVNV